MNDEFSLPDYVRPGATLRLFWNEGNVNNKRIHIRAIVDGGQVVYRWWSRKRGWIYKIDEPYWFWLLEDNGRVTVIKRGMDAPGQR